MNRFWSVCSAVILLIAVAKAADPEMEGDVIVLTDKNFNEIVNNADLILVEFYAPWCGHCKKLAPEYAVAATELKKSNVLLAKLDATVETASAGRFGISGYPTMKIFRKGNVGEYKGPRDSTGIISYMLKQVGDSAKALKTKEEYNNFVEHQDCSIVGFFPTKTGSYNTFLSTADALREEFRLAIITDAALVTELGFGQGVAVIKPWEDKKATIYSGIDSQTALTEFIYENSLPLVGEFSKETAPRYAKRGLPILKAYYDVDFKNNLKKTNYYVNRIKKAVEEVQGKLSFAVVKKSAYKDEMEKFGLNPSAEIQFAIDDQKASLKYKMSKEFSIENVKEFVNDFVAGKIKPYIKSQPIPENNEAVKVVVGETFNDIVMDPTKDVLFEMYAPWCGHCKNLEPVYKELAEKFKDVPSITIAKMDATANDSPHGKYQAKGYPTIMFAPANDKNNPIPYSGERTVKGFTDFLSQKANIKFKL